MGFKEDSNQIIIDTMRTISKSIEVLSENFSNTNTSSDQGIAEFTTKAILDLTEALCNLIEEGENNGKT